MEKISSLNNQIIAHFLFALLCILSPLTLIVSFYFFIDNWLNIERPLILLFFLLTGGMGIFSAMSLFKEDTVSKKIRIGFYAFLISLGLGFLLFRQSGFIAATFTLLMSLQFYFSMSLYRSFLNYGSTIRRYTTSKQANFKQRVRENIAEYEEMEIGFNQTRKIIICFCAIELLLSLISFKTGIPIALLPLFFFAFINGLLFIQIRILLSEWIYYGEGFSLKKEDKKNKRIGGGLILSGSLIFSFLLGSNRSLFPYAWLISFWNWLGQLLPEGKAIKLPPQPIQSTQNPAMGLEEMQRMVGDIKPWINIDWVLISKIAGIIALLGLAIFLFFPLARLKFKRLWSHFSELVAHFFSHLPVFFKEFIQTITVFLHSFSFDKQKKGSIKKDLSKSFTFNQKQKTTLRKKREQSFFLKKFTLLITWGNKNNLIFTSSTSVKAFCMNIYRRNPPLKEPAERIYRLFEKAFFSTEELSREERRIWLSALNKVISTETKDKTV